jgi:tetrapyrrole methylase family protein/MazG family protein
MTGRVVVVGLGPAGADLMVPAARVAFESAPRRFVRTHRHPAVADLVAAGTTCESFDATYDTASDLETVYRRIAESLVESARAHGTVAYGVPGSPGIAERTVVLLRRLADAGTIAVTIVPGISFADLAWARLGIDPLDGARVADARALSADELDRAGPLLLAQCDDPLLLGDVKLTLLERLDAGTPVTVLARLGLPDEQVSTVTVADLDHRVVPDHLTSLFVEIPERGPATEFARLLALAERLRGPGGCPWDAEQTHRSLTRYLLEEAYEVVDAVEALPRDAPVGADPDDAGYDALVDELGDLLYQVIFHAVLAREAGAFTMADVSRAIHEKLVRRHPHVFGAVEADTAEVVVRNWEQIKKDEKGVDSLVADITPGLPSLLFVHKLYRKAASVGLDSGDLEASVVRARRALDVISSPEADFDVALGELLAASVALARAGGVDAESALRGWAASFRARFTAMEVLARERGLDLAGLDPVLVAELWEATGP